MPLGVAAKPLLRNNLIVCLNETKNSQVQNMVVGLDVQRKRVILQTLHNRRHLLWRDRGPPAGAQQLLPVADNQWSYQRSK